MLKSLAVVVTFSALLCAGSAQSLRAQIESSNRTVCRLMMAKDVKGFKNYVRGWVTADFKYVENGKTENFSTMCKGMAMGFSQIKKLLKADTKIEDLHQNAKTATCTTSHSMESILNSPDKKSHRMTYNGTSRETYVKEGSKWKMSKMEWLNERMLVDGKPMNTGMAPPTKQD